MAKKNITKIVKKRSTSNLIIKIPTMWDHLNSIVA